MDLIAQYRYDDPLLVSPERPRIHCTLFHKPAPAGLSTDARLPKRLTSNVANIGSSFSHWLQLPERTYSLEHNWTPKQSC